MNTWRVLRTLLTLTAVASPPAIALDINNPPVGTFVDEWYVVRIEGKKSGHAHITMKRSQKTGDDVITSRTDMVIEISRAGQEAGVRLVQQSEETIDGKPLRFMNTIRLGALPGGITTRGTVADGKVTITTSQFGQETEPRVYPMPEGAMMSWAVYREQMKRGLKPGDKYELMAYEPSISADKVIPMSVEIMEPETIDLFGRKVQATKTSQVMHITNMLGQKSDVETLSWMTDDGNIVRSQMMVAKWKIEILAASKSVALSPNEPTELMTDALIPVSRPIDGRSDRITYRISLKNKVDRVRLSDIPETDMQRVLRRNESELDLVVTRRTSEGDRPGAKKLGDSPARRLAAKEKERYLTPSSVVNFKDPTVADLAKQAAGDEKDPLKLAERLCQFVSDYVEDKNLNVGFATASETARSKEGDCTEHGVLLAALGRAVGIPTRLVTGIVYARHFAGKEGVFVGHLWTQFFIDGRWVDLDSALGQTVADPTHIALSLSDAGDSGIADMVSSVWLNMGELKIEVLDGPGRKAISQPAGLVPASVPTLR
ncbi:MAG TPA: transglutaminase domain-containing protein [Phycisphaerae bacterium]|nr:transglutaminase domain-containing protein [Phycisphaerae bacterium]HRR87145.1 transglutaminase domain-containing protein [Phycisphaerae bacterium]